MQKFKVVVSKLYLEPRACVRACVKVTGTRWIQKRTSGIRCPALILCHIPTKQCWLQDLKLSWWSANPQQACPISAPILPTVQGVVSKQSRVAFHMDTRHLNSASCSHSILVRVFTTVIKHHDHIRLEEGKEDFSHTFTSQPSIQGGLGRNWCRGHGVVLLSGFPSLSSSSSQERQPRDGTTHMDWALPRQSPIKNVLYRLVQRPIWWGIFSIEVHFPPMTLASVKLPKT